MIDVYICEDDKQQLAFIEKTIGDAILFDDTDMRLVLASQCPDKILESAKKSENCDLYFLDVELGTDPFGGFHLAQKLREADPRCFIVFITSHSNFSFYTYEYKLEAMDYIIKKDYARMREQIISCLNEAYKRHIGGTLSHKSVFVMPQKADREIAVPYSEISLFKVNPENHKIAVHARNRYFEFFGNLADTKSQLDDRFFLCHRSCMINLNHVKAFLPDSCEVLMADETLCPVSARKRKELLKLLKQQEDDIFTRHLHKIKK